MENWKDIEGYEGLYQVSDMGRIRSLDREVMYSNGVVHKFKGNIRKLGLDKDGYRQVRLSKSNKQQTKKVHQLVAIAFIPNPENKPILDHIIPVSEGGTDEATNLRWCTIPENQNNPHTVLKRQMCVGWHRKGKRIAQYTKDGDLVAIWPNSFYAQKETGIKHQNIWKCLKGIYAHSGGFKWAYI